MNFLSSFLCSLSLYTFWFTGREEACEAVSFLSFILEMLGLNFGRDIDFLT
jgi:hypothetical protein